MFFRAFNSLHGFAGTNFSHVVLKIIIVKHTVPLSVNGEVDWGNDIINKSSAVAEMGNRLAKIDMGRKLGDVPPFWRGSWIPI